MSEPAAAEPTEFPIAEDAIRKLDADRERVEVLEKRLRVIESALIRNAIELRDRVVERLDRIEKQFGGKVDDLLGFELDPDPDFSDLEIESNVVVFPEELPKVNDRIRHMDAAASLQEFSQSLQHTRQHLEALTESISKMKVELSR